MNNKYRSVVTGLVFLLVGCTGLRPLPVRDPAPYQPVLDAKGKPTKADPVRSKPSVMKGGLLPATNLAEAKDNIKIYMDTYDDAYVELKTASYNADDAVFLGGLFGVIGGVAKSIETAATGAVIAAGGTIVSSRYNLEVQATNYQNAGDVMNCMWNKIAVVNGRDVVERDVAAGVNELISTVRRKLRRLQADIKLASPDLGGLKDALEKFRAQSAFLPQGAQNFASGTTEAANTANLLADLKTCAAAF